MAKLIVDYNKGRREFLAGIENNKILGLGSIDNKDQALFFAALGCEAPVELSAKKDEGGWFRTESFTKYSKDVAMMSCVLLGTAKSDEDFEKYSELETYIGHVEQCAERGFQIFEDLLEKADGDYALLEKRMLKELDLLYASKVEADI